MKRWRKSKRQAPPQQPSLPGLFAAQTKSRRLATPHEQALDLARSRLIVATVVFALAYTVIAGKVAFLTIMNVTPETPQAHLQASETVASRADIVDRNGVVLATSLPTISLCADAKFIPNPDEAAKELLSVLPDLDAERLKEDLHGQKHCAMIKRHLTPKQYYEVNKLGIAGLEFRPDEHRIYPLGNVASHVVGYTDIDNNGLAGVEKKLDTRLEEQPDSVQLSLDVRLQSIMHNELKAAIDNFHALGGAGLIMDVTNGEILSLVSLPDFDPQHPGASDEDARFNRDTLGVYEMGSTFKIFNTALALDSGMVHVRDSFDTVHPIPIGHQTIKDFHPENRWLNVAEIFTHSSNIGAAHMAERVGGVRQRAFLTKLGLTERMPLEVSEIGTPLVPAAKDWGEPTTMTVAFGHGIAVNTIQLASAIAAIVNDGVPIHPTLLKYTAPLQTTTEDRVISPHTSAMMRAMMRLVVTRGTAKGADVAGYMLGGKTGTADKLSVSHKYGSNGRLSSFVGVFPLNAPKYLVFALLDDPKGNAKTYGYATGGWTAAPVVQKIVTQMGPLMDVPPLAPDMEEQAERSILKSLGPEIVDGMPVEEGSDYAAVEGDSVQ